MDLGETAGLPDAALSVAVAYATLRDDILRGTHAAPGFDHAVRLTRLVEDAIESSRSGCRRPSNDWPA